MKHQNTPLDEKQDKLFKEMLKFSKLPSSLKDDIIKDQQQTKSEKLSSNEVNSSYKNKIKAQNITIVNDNINKTLSSNQIEFNNSDKVNNQIENKKTLCSSSSKNNQQSANSYKNNRPIYTSDTHYSNSAYLNSPEPYMLPIPIFLEEQEEVENSNNSSNSNKLRSPNKNNIDIHTKVHDSTSTISYSEIVKNKTTPDKSSILKNFLKIRKSS